MKAIEKAGYRPGEQVAIALDCASSELFDEGGRKGYKFWKTNPDKLFTADELIELYTKWVGKYPIISIEDGLDQNDWEGYVKLTKALGNKIQIMGDDFFVTNTKRLEKGIAMGACNSILIKLNQIGTVTETIEAITMAKRAGYTAVVSHRSGERGRLYSRPHRGHGTGQIKTGSMSCTDRICNNQLMRIEDEMEGIASIGKESLLQRPWIRRDTIPGFWGLTGFGRKIVQFNPTRGLSGMAGPFYVLSTRHKRRGHIRF